ncbi:MAG TPA: DUF4175 domain-containing protein [Polyangiaceae bacterium]|nr:DUF4175 domain-containing protein [Polyangiaceae bacterium]
MEPHSALSELAEGYRRRQRPALRALLWASLSAALVAAAFVGRAGTDGMRAIAALLLAAVFTAFVLRHWWERRALKSPSGIAERLVLPVDRELGQRLLRALRLVARATVDSSVGSPELAKLYAKRIASRVSPALVERRARRLRTLRRASAWVLGAAAFVSLAVDPARVLEGLDVLLARGGRAPFAMTWLNTVSATAQPPSYLRSADRALFPGSSGEEPRGSLVVVRGVPERPGRTLLLTDGEREVPFTSDAAGGVVARWPLERDSELRVAARFGNVLIVESETLPLRAVLDSEPKVELEGAPVTLELAKLERLELRYEASDDHGLRQVDLVLRSGGREDRRMLGKLDGQSRFERGAHALDPRDPFLRRMFLPVTVTVEARDNDAIAGNKWGRSEPITLQPPAVGEPEALRYKALAAARDQVTDLLAFLLDGPEKVDLAAQAERRRQEAERVNAAVLALRSAAQAGYAGLRVSAGAEAFLLGQARALERRGVTQAAEQRKVEEALLAVDAALRKLGNRDAQSVSKRLGDVAEDVAEGLKEARETERQRAGVARYKAALEALQRGADQLFALDALGRDIGSVARGEIRRIRRAEQGGSLVHAELAARHLAARLRRPNPSFTSAGRGGVESGEHGGGGEPRGDATQADKRFNQQAEELQQLVQEHQAGLEQVERAMNDAENVAELEDLKKEARERAAQLRQKFEDLPNAGGTPGSARGAAGLAREHANAMAQRLERLMLRDSVESGRNAHSLLDEARRKIKEDPNSPSNFLNEDALKEADRELSEQLSWAEQALERLRQKAEERAKSALSDSGQKEQELARRTGNLAGRGAHGEATLPEDLVDALERAESVMREAARELGNGRGERGLDLQREAQRLLEQSDRGRLDQDDDGNRSQNSNSNKRSNKDSVNGKQMDTHAEVPRPDERKAAEEFRRRVLEGLGQGKGQRLAPAVQRYAEGLLQ